MGLTVEEVAAVLLKPLVGSLLMESELDTGGAVKPLITTLIDSLSKTVSFVARRARCAMSELSVSSVAKIG